MHVGSGKANYGVVDQLVQRDPTFQYPTIHSSSLKGAIKEYCHHAHYQNIKEVFGSEKQDGKTNHAESQIGSYKFFDANLLAIPVRCDKRAFVHITCPLILNDLSNQYTELKEDLKILSGIFNSSDAPKAYAFSSDLNSATIEDFDIKATYDESKQSLLTNSVNKLFGYDIVIVQDEYFKRLTNDLHLPVIARNYLENGESKNLWYEQVVPRLSLFWSMIFFDNDYKLFDWISGENKLIQVGANGSIGYGFCSFSKI
ncbi:type III-B CRISPR module RAMP protein Cmr4 [Bacteroidia bacterium]|nr:type III-B CRISPR module RAMP protein Cmr4 [Bacteroidia bacterium]